MLEVRAETLKKYAIFLSVFSYIYIFFFTLLSQKDGRPDRSYFSPDCFHLSQKAHTLMARALWNNMVGFTLLENISYICILSHVVFISLVMIQNKSPTFTIS